jgi:hypothetical protein
VCVVSVVLRSRVCRDVYCVWRVVYEVCGVW